MVRGQLSQAARRVLGGRLRFEAREARIQSGFDRSEGFCDGRLAGQIRGECGVQVRTLTLDLTQSDLLDQVSGSTEDIEVSLLIYNAGASHRVGPYLNGKLDAALRILRLNPIGQILLTYHFGKAMAARGRGGIILVGSMAGIAGAATVATYSGAKAFTQVFAEALWTELEPQGVDVRCAVLGATDTPAMKRLGIEFGPSRAADPDSVARESLAALRNGPVFVPAAEVERFRRLYSLSRKEATRLMSGVLVENAPSK